MIRCAAFDCTTRIPNRDVACRPHWNMLPTSFRRSFIHASHTRNLKAIDVCRRNAPFLIEHT